jgi:hypothetical protein
MNINPRPDDITDKSGKGKYVTVNAVAAWFHGFYDLRNAIVHGDKIPRARRCLKPERQS